MTAVCFERFIFLKCCVHYARAKFSLAFLHTYMIKQDIFFEKWHHYKLQPVISAGLNTMIVPHFTILHTAVSTCEEPYTELD